MSLHPEKAKIPCQIEADLFTWMTVHGNLQLALRHPENVGPSRAVMENFVQSLEEILVRGGIIDQEDIDRGRTLEKSQHRLMRS
jgi:hypothetical protein